MSVKSRNMEIDQPSMHFEENLVILQGRAEAALQKRQKLIDGKQIIGILLLIRYLRSLH